MEATRVLPLQKVEQAITAEVNDTRPTEIRYGWCPFADIGLTGPDGTPALYVQPNQIADGQLVTRNPFHWVLPHNQLIPFPTFTAPLWGLSESQRDSRGLAMPVQTSHSLTALENVTMVARMYSGWGFTILSSLQGLDQDVAGRIFQVVQPLNYLLKDLPSEMEIGAFERIEAMEDIVFNLQDGPYVIPALTTDYERAIARKLADEMAGGASIAWTYGTTVLNDTIMSINTRLSGGQGKAGPDTLDRYLMVQLGRENDLPTAGGSAPTAGLEAKLNYLVEGERARAAMAEIDQLKAEIAALKQTSTSVVDEIQTVINVCGAEKSTGGTCKMTLKDGQCPYHPKEVE